MSRSHWSRFAGLLLVALVATSTPHGTLADSSQNFTIVDPGFQSPFTIQGSSGIGGVGTYRVDGADAATYLYGAGQASTVVRNGIPDVSGIVRMTLLDRTTTDRPLGLYTASVTSRVTRQFRVTDSLDPSREGFTMLRIDAELSGDWSLDDLLQGTNSFVSATAGYPFPDAAFTSCTITPSIQSCENGVTLSSSGGIGFGQSFEAQVALGSFSADVMVPVNDVITIGSEILISVGHDSTQPYDVTVEADFETTLSAVVTPLDPNVVLPAPKASASALVATTLLASLGAARRRANPPR